MNEVKLLMKIGLSIYRQPQFRRPIGFFFHQKLVFDLPKKRNWWEHFFMGECDVSLKNGSMYKEYTLKSVSKFPMFLLVNQIM